MANGGKGTCEMGVPVFCFCFKLTKGALNTRCGKRKPNLGVFSNVYVVRM